MLEDPGDGSTAQTASSSLLNNNSTEIEYNLQFNSNATANAYCLRVSNAGSGLQSYAHVAEAVILHPPTISNISLNGGQNITLIEGTTTTVTATSTVSDLNGYADMVSATSTIYRSGVSGGASCNASLASCYQIPANQCTFSNCSGTSCLLTCSASIQYFADSTDATSTFNGQTWQATMAVQDSTALRDTETILGGVPLNSLAAIEINTPAINFGSMIPGADTGTTNATTTVLNTGNILINLSISGSNLVSAGNTTPILPGQQKFATSTFQYASCSLCSLLSGSANTVGVEIPKPVSTSSTSSQSSLYWGLQVPNNTNSGGYNGVNTFTAVPG